MVTPEILLKAYRHMCLAKSMADIYEQNRAVCKYVHSTSRGHEAIQLATAFQLQPQDYVSPYYRDESMLLGLGFSISCAIRLRGAAEQFRKDVLKRLWEKQLRLAGEGNESKGLSKKIDLMIDHIKSIRSGAFVPFIDQPWVRATLIFITSGGGLTVLQYLPWFQ